MRFGGAWDERRTWNDAGWHGFARSFEAHAPAAFPTERNTPEEQALLDAFGVFKSLFIHVKVGGKAAELAGELVAATAALDGMLSAFDDRLGRYMCVCVCVCVCVRWAEKTGG